MDIVERLRLFAKDNASTDTFADNAIIWNGKSHTLCTKGERVMDYDMTIHHNPDAQAWAKFFIETTKDMERDVFRDEGYMITWFANAMMAMHDHLYKTEIEGMHRILCKIADALKEKE